MPFLVIDSSFNRANYPDLIGEVFDEPPAYAMVKEIESTDDDPLDDDRDPENSCEFTEDMDWGKWDIDSDPDWR